ncbi:cupin domain-containing protein [Microbacterium sp. P05]|uniref:cupin domain-containing protein n=1 Tax=Microbacterium sp. P05 TaxID=3366948 RepID=UPI003745E291
MSDAVSDETPHDFAERRTLDGRLIERLRRPPLAVALGLQPHPEGGWYRRTWASPQTVPFDGDRSTRPAATLILFLLPAGEASGWHRVASSEIWIWNGLGSVALQYGGDGESPEDTEVLTLGDPREGMTVQAVVPPNVWQRTLPAGHDGLVSCLVSPGFDFADFTMPDVDGRSGDHR